MTVGIQTDNEAVELSMQKGGALKGFCPIANKDVSYSVGQLIGIPLTVLCENTECEFHVHI